MTPAPDPRQALRASGDGQIGLWLDSVRQFSACIHGSDSLEDSESRANPSLDELAASRVHCQP